MAVGFGFCSNCGAPLTKAQQKFCAVCGATLLVRPPAPEPAPGQPQPPEPVQPSQSYRPQPPQPYQPQPSQSAPPAFPGPSAPPPSAWAQTPPTSTPPTQWQTNAQPQTPPQWNAAPSIPSGPAGGPIPQSGTTGAVTKSGLTGNPVVLVGGLVLILAVAGAGYMAMNNRNPTPTGPAGTPVPTLASGSAGPTERPTPVATPTTATGAGTVAVTPAKFPCSAPGSATLTFALPASIDGATEISLEIDDADAGTQTVSTLMTQTADGSWTASQDDEISALCSEYGVGAHVVKILDPDGKVLAQTTFTITAGATPTPAKGTVSIVVQPGQFSCSTSGLTIKMAIVLPASIDPQTSVTLTLDDEALSSDTVQSGFEKQADGSWLSTGSVAASDLCGYGTGTHVLKLLDGDGKLLGQASFTAQP
jgi:hypothetical protein